jgi:hypothetical protein
MIVPELLSHDVTTMKMYGGKRAAAKADGER